MKIDTDAGISGIGEATLEIKELSVAAAVDELADYLVGKDPRSIEEHYHAMYRDSYWRIGPVLMSAISGVEMCLWDIAAKDLGVPVYRLFGGKCNDWVKGYANGWYSGARSGEDGVLNSSSAQTPEEFAQRARDAVARGFRALKWDPFGKSYMNLSPAEMNGVLATIGAVRQAVGGEIDLLIEGHGRFNTHTALKICREIEQFKPLFFEEPVPPDDMDALAEVTRKSHVAIAAGERLYTRYQFKDFFQKRAAHIAQPDVSHAGGISECRKIAAMAEAWYVPFAPHNPSGPVATAATLQLAACTPNFYLLEIMATDVPWRGEITDESIEFKDGYFRIPDKPGLGIELDELVAADYPYEAKALRHYRGDLTDIRPPDAMEFY